MTTSACGPSTMRSTVAASIGRFSATMPPNAERSSHSSARWYASARSCRDRDAARVRVLDDRARRTVAEVVHELPRRVGVVEVEVRQREPAVLRARSPTSSWRRAGGSAPPADAGSRRSAASRRCVRARAPGAAGAASPCLQPLHDRGVVRGRVRERLEREARVASPRSRFRRSRAALRGARRTARGS